MAGNTIIEGYDSMIREAPLPIKDLITESVRREREVECKIHICVKRTERLCVTGGKDEKGILIVVDNNGICLRFNFCRLQKERRSAATTTARFSSSSGANTNNTTTSERC
jgi:hypothetical protein